MRYHETIPTRLSQIEKRFAVRSRDLGRAVTWFERDVASGGASWPMVRSEASGVRFTSRVDADRFATAAVGRARWRSENGRIVYFGDRTRAAADRKAQTDFARGSLDRLGAAGRGEIVDGVIIDCSFASHRAATEFAHALNAADLSL